MPEVAEIAHKKSRVEARLTPANMRLIRRAAALQGRSVSDFMVSAARQAAEAALQDELMIRLSEKDQRAIYKELIKPAALSPAMRRALKRYQKNKSAS